MQALSLCFDLGAESGKKNLMRSLFQKLSKAFPTFWKFIRYSADLFFLLLVLGILQKRLINDEYLLELYTYFREFFLFYVFLWRWKGIEFYGDITRFVMFFNVYTSFTIFFYAKSFYYHEQPKRFSIEIEKYLTVNFRNINARFDYLSIWSVWRKTIHVSERFKIKTH